MIAEKRASVIVIYMVEHVYTDPSTESAWHDWYLAYQQKLLAVPGIHSAQRFKAIGHTPPRYMAMYSIDSEDVYSSEPYRNMGGGGSQSARFHYAYALWTRDLFAGAERAPLVAERQTVLVWDRPEREHSGKLDSRATWLHAVALHKTTPWRAFVVLDRTEAASVTRPAGSFLYEPFTRVRQPGEVK